MAGLSISRAWEETKAALAGDGRLITTIAAALIALPTLILGVIEPAGTANAASTSSFVLLLATSLIAVVGQLAIIRLVLSPGISVGEAIGHGARRMPVYFVSGLIILIGCVLLLIPFGIVTYALGAPMQEDAMARSPAVMLMALIFAILILLLAVRLIMASPVASEEAAGPIAILKRSWALTAGHWARLLGFIMLFLIGALAAISAVNWVARFIAVLLLGQVEPMSASALLVALASAIVNAAVTAIFAVMLARIYVQLAGRDAAPASVPTSGT